MKKKKIPLRKCLGCNEMKSKKELIRVVKDKEGELFIDLKGKANGRGAYICKDIGCFESAYSSKRLNRALKADIPDEIYDRLKEEIENE